MGSDTGDWIKKGIKGGINAPEHLFKGDFTSLKDDLGDIVEGGYKTGPLYAGLKAYDDYTQPKIPKMPTTELITPTSQVQREASTALADLNMRLRQAGSRGKSNMGIEQLKPLPSMQGPRLGAKLG